MVTGLAGCVSRQQEEAAEARGEAVMDYHELSMLPDSAMTAEQLALKKQLERITIMNMEASGDEEVFAVEREYFIEHGIPVEYYDSIQKQVDRNNALWQWNIEHFGDVENLDWKNRSRLGQCAGADWDTFDAAKLMIFSETVAF